MPNLNTTTAPADLKFHIETTPNSKQSSEIDFSYLSDSSNDDVTDKVPLDLSKSSEKIIEEHFMNDPIEKSDLQEPLLGHEKFEEIKPAPKKPEVTSENIHWGLFLIDCKSLDNIPADNFENYCKTLTRLLDEYKSINPSHITLDPYSMKVSEKSFLQFIQISQLLLQGVRFKSKYLLNRDPQDTTLLKDSIKEDFIALRNDLENAYDYADPNSNFRGRVNDATLQKSAQNTAAFFKENLTRLNKLVDHTANVVKNFEDNYQPVKYPAKFQNIADYLEKRDSLVERAIEILHQYAGPDSSVGKDRYGKDPSAREVIGNKLAFFANRIRHPKHHHRDEAKQLISALLPFVRCNNLWTSQPLPLSSDEFTKAFNKVKEQKYFLITQGADKNSQYFKSINFILENLFKPYMNVAQIQSQPSIRISNR